MRRSTTFAGLRMATIERADAHGEYQVVRLFARRESELFGGGVSDAHACRRDQVRGSGCGLCNRRRGPVDCQDVAPGEPRGDGTSGRTGAAADLEDARLRA